MMWQTLGVKSINAIFTHPNLSSKQKMNHNACVWFE